MKNTFRIAALVALLSLGCQSAEVAPPTVIHKPSVNVAHYIEFDSKLQDAECSSVAVGQHTLLTAAHCVLGTSILTVDGEKALIAGIQYDENEHMLLELTGVSFTDITTIDQRQPLADEEVWMWGWPLDADSPIGREGRYEKQDKDGLVFQVLIAPGDSGSGVLDKDGAVITVVSLGQNNGAHMVAFPLKFTQDQLNAIR